MIEPLETEERTAEVVSLLKLRAERASRSQGTGEDEAAVWVAEFTVGDESFAVPLTQLRAAVPLRMVTPVPLAPAGVIGVVRFQGDPVTVFSLASLLGIRGWREDPMVLIVVEPQPGHKVALDCEQIPKPTALPRAAFEAALTSSSAAYAEVTTPELRQVNVLDVSRLLARRQRVK